MALEAVGSTPITHPRRDFTTLAPKQGMVYNNPALLRFTYFFTRTVSLVGRAGDS